MQYSYVLINKNNPKVKVHPFQYSLIGVSMGLFYLLLTSLSEFITFGLAYFLASILTILLISVYVYFVITKKKDNVFSLTIFGGLSLLYTYLYVLLQLQDLSLLLGSIGLFIIIGTIMYSTRNVEWY